MAQDPDAWEVWPEVSRPLSSAHNDTAHADCLRIWAGLLSREYVLIDHATTLTNAYVAVARNPCKSPPISPRNQHILEQLCLGDSAKVVAIDAGVSNSTVTSVLKRSLEALGLQETSRVPLSLAMLAHAARGGARVTMQRVSGRMRRGVECEILGAKLPSLELLLPPAVRDVVCMHTQGDSHARIASRRRTSQRTVANQLATAFSRLGVSGRSGLLVYFSLASARDNAAV